MPDYKSEWKCNTKELIGQKLKSITINNSIHITIVTDKSKVYTLNASPYEFGIAPIHKIEGGIHNIYGEIITDIKEIKVYDKPSDTHTISLNILTNKNNLHVTWMVENEFYYEPGLEFIDWALVPNKKPNICSNNSLEYVLAVAK